VLLSKNIKPNLNRNTRENKQKTAILHGKPDERTTGPASEREKKGKEKGKDKKRGRKEDTKRDTFDAFFHKGGKISPFLQRVNGGKRGIRFGGERQGGGKGGAYKTYQTNHKAYSSRKPKFGGMGRERTYCRV